MARFRTSPQYRHSLQAHGAGCRVERRFHPVYAPAHALLAAPEVHVFSPDACPGIDRMDGAGVRFPFDGRSDRDAGLAVAGASHERDDALPRHDDGVGRIAWLVDTDAEDGPRRLLSNRVPLPRGINGPDDRAMDICRVHPVRRTLVGRPPGAGAACACGAAVATTHRLNPLRHSAPRSTAPASRPHRDASFFCAVGARGAPAGIT